MSNSRQQLNDFMKKLDPTFGEEKKLKPFNEKWKTFYLCNSYEQWHIDSYQDQVDNKFYGDEPCDFEDYVADLEWENSQEFADIMDHYGEKE